MSITIDATSTTTSGAAESGNTTITRSHTSAGDYLRVGISFRTDAGQTVSSVTFNGAALTLVDTSTNGSSRVEQWGMVAPAAGLHDVVVTMSADTASLNVGVTTYSGVDQTTPTRTPAHATGSSTNPTVNVTAVVGDMVVDALVGSPLFTLDAVGAGQTQEWNISDSGAQFRRGGGSHETAASTTVTMDWTVSTASTWAISAFALVPASGASPITVIPGFVATGEAMYSPLIVATVIPGFLSTGEAMYAPVVSLAGGPITLVPGFVSSGEALYGPAIATMLVPGFIASGEALYAPNVQRTVAPGFIATGETLYGPAIRTSVIPGFIVSGEVLYLPNVHGPVGGPVTVIPGFILDSSGVFTPVVFFPHLVGELLTAYLRRGLQTTYRRRALDSIYTRRD